MKTYEKVALCGMCAGVIALEAMPHFCVPKQQGQVTVQRPANKFNPMCYMTHVEAAALEDLLNEHQRFPYELPANNTVFGTANVTVSGTQGTLYKINS